jgi:hypothetical protein
MKALKEDGNIDKAEMKPDISPKKTPSKPATATPTKPKPMRQAKEEKYKELPKLIGDVKKLLSLAKESGIDITAHKALVSQAVSASKKKDLNTAIKLMVDGKTALEKDLRGIIMGKQRTFSSAVSLARKGGKDTTGIERVLDSIKKAVEADDYHTAMSEAKRAENVVESLSGATAITQVEIEVIERTIQDALALNVNVAKAQSLYEEAKIATANKDREKVSVLTKEINESLMKILPRYIAKEMREAKSDLRDIKMMNIDITKPVDILKKANNSVKDGDYSAALHSIKEFKEFVDKMQKAT